MTNSFKYSIKDLTLVVALGVLPMVFLFVNYIGIIKAKSVYDLFWLVFAVYLVFLSFQRGLQVKGFSKILLSTLAFFISVSVLKFFVIGGAFAFRDYFQLMPFLKEYKITLYLIFVFLYLGLFKKVDIKLFEKSGAFLATLIILDFLIKLTVYGTITRPEVIDEANYDNALILLALLARIKNKGFKTDLYFLLVVAATMASQSKTGIVCLIVISVINYRYDGNVIVPFFLLFLIVVSSIAVAYRLSNDRIVNLEDVDRIKMLKSFWLIQTNSSFFELLFGHSAGYPLALNDPYINYFIDWQVVSEGGVGLHPFNYHGMWFRLICTWGWPFVFSILSVLFYWGLQSRHNFSFFSFILIQGLPMSLFYLSAVGPLTLLLLASLTDDVEGQPGEFEHGKEDSICMV